MEPASLEENSRPTGVLGFSDLRVGTTGKMDCTHQTVLLFPSHNIKDFKGCNTALSKTGHREYIGEMRQVFFI